MNEQPTVVKTCVVTLYVAGDYASAAAEIRKICYRKGLCVTVTPTKFFYTGGEEDGVAIGLVNYPRFPSNRTELFATAVAIAEALIPVMNQKTALVVAPDETLWVTITPPGAVK